MFKDEGIRYTCTYEPGGTPISDCIREVLLDAKNTEMEAMTELLLYLASRKQHLEEIIKPALKDGVLVLCDRYEDSSLIYQGIARGIGIGKVRALSRAAGIDLEPDLTVVFDVPAETGLERARGRSLEGITRFENERMKFHERVREGFLALAEEEKHRFVVVDTTKPFAEVHEELHRLIIKKLKESR